MGTLISTKLDPVDTRSLLRLDLIRFMIIMLIINVSELVLGNVSEGLEYSPSCVTIVEL